jgi:hypothetical protein
MAAVFDKVSDFWLQLLNDCPPKPAATTMSHIIELNQGEMNKVVDHLKSSLGLMSIETLNTFMSKEKYWIRQTNDYVRRIELLKTMLEYRGKGHVEMLDLSKFRMIVDVKKLSCIFSKSYFVNLTVQENSYNSLLTLQGYFLKNFIYFHMRHDMRFKASIDSFMIEMDNPRARNAIRNENRHDDFLSSKYLGKKDDFNVETFCEHLLSNFFPNIAGIWADHSQMAPAYILQFIRLCLEYGLISSTKAEKYLELLVKATSSLMKLEEAWLERPTELKKFSVKIKLYNITNLFSKCREHISMILINILVLINDDFFMTKFPEYVVRDTSEEKIVEEVKENFLFFNKKINDAVLFITMNYLSNPVELMEFKSTNDFSNSCIEKIFFMITTWQNDCFLTSLKQITGKDLYYIGVSENDVISADLRQMADQAGYALRTLINSLGMGIFDKEQGKMITGPTDKAFETYLKKYVSNPDSSSVETILDKMFAELRDAIKLDEDYKMAVVKESIPQKLVTLVHYCNQYLETKAYLPIAKKCFKMIGDISENNNSCKSQLFKGDSLYHFRKLLSKFDLDSFTLMYRVCGEVNASVFLGKEVFNMFLGFYEKFNSEICKHLDLENPAQNLNKESCGTLLLMIKYMHKLFSKNFLNETDKLQNTLLTQEVMFKSLSELYIPLLIKQSQLQSEISKEKPTTGLHNLLFEEGCEMELMKTVRSSESDDKNSQLILVNHLAFWSLKLYNRLCNFCFSYKQYELMLPFTEELIDFLKDKGGPASNNWMLPIGLEAEVYTFLRNIRFLPQQNMLIEGSMNTVEHVIGSSFMKEKTEAQHQLQKAVRDLASAHHLLNDLDNTSNKNRLQTQIENLQQTIKEQKATIKGFAMKEIELILFLTKRVELYLEESNKKEVSLLIFEGLFPLLYNFLSAFHSVNLVVNSKECKVVIDSMKALLEGFAPLLAPINEILGQKVEFDIGGLELLKHSTDGSDGGTKLQHTASIAPKRSNTVDFEMLEKTALDACDAMLKVIEAFYEGQTEFISPSVLKKDITKDEYQESIFEIKFDEEKLTGLEAIKQNKLNYFIKGYKEAKDEYLERKEEPNLIGFFDRNNQNLRGVFNSCLDRLLNRKKPERNVVKENLSDNIPLSKFWTSRSVRGYINMVAILISNSKTGRKELYEYISEEDKKDEDDESMMDDEVLEEVHSAREYINSRESEEDRGQVKVHKEDLLAALIRIHTDLVFYLNASSSRHAIWWVTHQTYEMISMFFKNLCECNFLKFKVYLGTKTPYLKDENWKRICKEKSYSSVFSLELSSVMKTTRIGANREPVMIRSDFHDRVQEILFPLLEIINEATIGPCEANQTIFLQTDTTSLCNIATRLIDDMDSDFYDLASMTLSVIIALMEGTDSNDKEEEKLKLENRNILEKLATKMPASILADRVVRLTKKLYIQQLMKEDKFEEKVQEKLNKNFFSAFLSKSFNLLKVGKSKEEKEPSSMTELPYERVSNSQVHSAGPIPRNSVLPILDKKNPGPLKENPAFLAVKTKATNLITEEIENSIDINHWTELLDMYMNNSDFSNSPIFEFCFRLIVLWKGLALLSKSHSNRLAEVDYESNTYFQDTGFFFLKMSNKKKKKSKGEKNEKETSELSCVYYFLTKKIMCEVEILNPNQKSVILYFPRLPETFMLADEAKVNYREDCDISDSNTKMVDLLRNFDLFQIKMDSSHSLAKKLGIFYKSVSTDAFLFYTVVCWWIGFFLNIALCVGLAYVNNSDDYVSRNDQYRQAILAFSFILITLSSLLLFLWLISKYVPTYRTSREDYKFENFGKSPYTFKAVLVIGLKKSLLEQPFPMSYMLHMLFTVLGLTYSPIFYTFNLLLIINISTTTKFVLKAILLHIDQLGITFMLAIFVIFCYTILAMTSLFEQINVEAGNNVCNELYSCFFFVLNYGLRNGGGFAESLTAIDTSKKFAGRTIFDISFFMLITVISLNIIFGIIIDTFSQLRDAQYERSRLYLQSLRL